MNAVRSARTIAGRCGVLLGVFALTVTGISMVNVMQPVAAQAATEFAPYGLNNARAVNTYLTGNPATPIDYFTIVRGALPPKKVTCVGDSITYGLGAEAYSYPIQLQQKLGDQWVVENDGVSSTTANSALNPAYVDTPAYQTALKSEPDVVLIMLGSNDSVPGNQTANAQATFAANYGALISSFVDLPSHPQVYVVTPITSFNDYVPESYLASVMRPAIRDLAQSLGLPRIEFSQILDDPSQFLSDGIHPNQAGYDLMSTAFYDVLTGAGQPVMTVSDQTAATDWQTPVTVQVDLPK